MKLFKLSTAAALIVAASAASATVTFDPNTGTGFVGKGDVQIPYGWNNAQLQRNASGLTFVYIATETYAAVCTWTTGEGTRGQHTHIITQSKKIGISDNITFDARVRSQITGFNLTGIGSSTTVGAVPVVGGVCPGEGTDGAWTQVDLVSSAIELDAVYGGANAKIWPVAL